MKQCNDMFPLDTEEESCGSGVIVWVLIMLLIAVVAIVGLVAL
jgi:flagellar basal body-associated protein FliL